MDRNNNFIQMWVRMTGRLPDAEDDGLFVRPTSVGGWIIWLFVWGLVAAVVLFSLVGLARYAISLLR